jgi:hypothetical protein
MHPQLSVINPKHGTAAFALMFFFARLGIDWLFRWHLPGTPVPPLWAVALTLGLDTAIASLAVYGFLILMKRERAAIVELNHELRNSLQVLAYALPDCDQRSQEHLTVALDRMTGTLRKLSRLTGTSPDRYAADKVRRYTPHDASR